MMDAFYSDLKIFMKDKCNGFQLTKVWSGTTIANYLPGWDVNYVIVEGHYPGDDIKYYNFFNAADKNYGTPDQFNTMSIQIQTMILRETKYFSYETEADQGGVSEPPCYCESPSMHDANCQWYLTCSRKARGLGW